MNVFVIREQLSNHREESNNRNWVMERGGNGQTRQSTSGCGGRRMAEVRYRCRTECADQQKAKGIEGGESGERKSRVLQ